MIIPDFLNRDDYIQNPIMHRFLKEHHITHLSSISTRERYLSEIEKYANTSPQNEFEVLQWLLKVAKEGTKDICYKKLYDLETANLTPDYIEEKINKTFPYCPNTDLIHYQSTSDQELVNYSIISQDGKVQKIEFTFSRLFLYGTPDQIGDKLVYPVFVDVYLEEGFIVGRGKAKSTLYNYSNDDLMVIPDYKISTMNHISQTMDMILSCFEYNTENQKRIVHSNNSQMLYKLYEKYSFTPDEVKSKVATQKAFCSAFARQLFENLGLDIQNLPTALSDLEILTEKFISINGDNEDVFKNDREAYLIKVSTNDDLEMTKVDTTSNRQKPLQCTEAFFDGKKSVIKSMACSKLNFVFKRKNNSYWNQPLVVQMGTKNNWGYLKTTQYAEEEDIQYVLQTIFENY